MSSIPGIHGNVTRSLQTSNHRFLINEAGVLLYQATPEQEIDELMRSQAVELSFTEILAFADFVEQRRKQLAQAQQQLERTLCMVADELIDRFEEHSPGSAVHALESQMKNLLGELRTVTLRGPDPTQSVAGLWYQSLDPRWTSCYFWTTMGSLFAGLPPTPL